MAKIITKRKRVAAEAIKSESALIRCDLRMPRVTYLRTPKFLLLKSLIYISLTVSLLSRAMDIYCYRMLIWSSTWRYLVMEVILN